MNLIESRINHLNHLNNLTYLKFTAAAAAGIALAISYGFQNAAEPDGVSEKIEQTEMFEVENPSVAPNILESGLQQ